MSLSAALNLAQTALLNTARQTSVVSRNVTDASNPDYARREAILVSTGAGSRVAEIRRATDEVLQKQNLGSLSSWKGQSTLLAGLESLSTTLNGKDGSTSAAKSLGELQSALDLYATSPSNSAAAENAIEAARQFARNLNAGSTAVQQARNDADTAIAAGVGDLNQLLKDFDAANKSVVSARASGTDPSDAMDRRDSVLKQISAYVPVSTITRANDDMVLTTQNGITLFETTARPVTFSASPSLPPGTAGNAIYIDGVPLSGGSGGNSSASGSLAALVQLRDTVAPTMQMQLDEIARGAIMAFAETDQTGGGAPALAGLFTWSGGPALPASGVATTGLAASIQVNAAMDSTVGGSPSVLRDGGANGAAYAANPSGNSAFTTKLLSYADALTSPIALDGRAGLGGSSAVTTASSDAVGWLSNLRKQASEAEQSKNALYTRTSESLANATGVNIDEEMSMLLELENSYSASARLIQTADEMLKTLLAMA